MSSPKSKQDEDQSPMAEIKQEQNEDQPVPVNQSSSLQQDGTNEDGNDLRPTLRRMEATMATINENISRINAQLRYNLTRKRKSSASDNTDHEQKKLRTKAVLEDLAVRVERMEARERNKGNIQPTTAPAVPLQPKPAAQVRRAQSPQPSSSGIPATLKDCIFCGGRHWATDCDHYTTLTARRNRLYELHRCERCLTPNNHLVTACSAKSSCFYCKRANITADMTKHHSAFCVYQFEM